MAQKVEVRSSGIFSKIFIDGQELKNVSSFEIKHEYGKKPSLVVKFPFVELEATLDEAWTGSGYEKIWMKEE